MSNLTQSAIAADFASLADNTETVTLTPQNPAATAITGITALRRALQRRDMDAVAGLSVENDVIVWHLPSSALGSTAPKQGDIITAGSEVWTILSAEKQTLGTRWRFVCVKRRA